MKVKTVLALFLILLLASCIRVPQNRLMNGYERSMGIPNQPQPMFLDTSGQHYVQGQYAYPQGMVVEPQPGPYQMTPTESITAEVADEPYYTERSSTYAPSGIGLAYAPTPSVPTKVVSARHVRHEEPSLKFRFADVENFNDWSLWNKTRYYRSHYSLSKFRREIARLNGFPNSEQYFRKIGLKHFPSGVILLPPLPNGNPYDGRGSASSKESVVKHESSTPATVATITARPVPAPNFEPLQKVQEETAAAVKKVDDSVTRLSASYEAGQKELIASLNSIAEELKKLGVKLDELNKRLPPVTAVTPPTAPTKTIKSDSQWILIVLGILLTGSLIAAFTKIFSRRRKSNLRAEIAESKLAFLQSVRHPRSFCRPAHYSIPHPLGNYRTKRGGYAHMH